MIMAQENKKERILWLDWARAIAILLVVISHLGGVYWQSRGIETGFKNTLGIVMDKLGVVQFGGAWGVGIFFLLAGYLSAQTSAGLSTKEYLIKRFFRIYPLFFVCTSVFYWWQNGSPTVAGWITRLNILEFRARLHDFSPVIWTLYIEVLFYVIFWILYIAVKTPRKILVASWIMVIIAGLLGQTRIPYLKSLAFHFSFLPIMFMGSMYFYWKSGQIMLKELLVGAMISAGVLARMLATYHPLESYSGHWYIISLFWSGVVFVALDLIKNKLEKVPKNINRIVGGISLVSYSWYLWHTNVGYWLLDLGKNWGRDGIRALGVGGITLILAWFSCRLIEKNFLAWGRVISRK